MRRFPFPAALALTVSLLVLPAGAADYSDLPAGHWAYADMTQAAALGLIRGMEDGRMAPDETLTWGQYLVMLTRTFYPDDYAAALGRGLAWNEAGRHVALENSLLRSNDPTPMAQGDLSSPILRKDAVLLLDRLLPDGSLGRWEEGGRLTAKDSFPDWDSLTSPYQYALSRLFDASIVLGRLDGSFDGEAVIQRTDGAILLLRLVREVDRQLWGAETPVTLHIVSEAGEPLCPDQTVTARVNYYLPGYVDETELTGYALREDLLTLTAVSSVQDTYTLVYRPLTPAEAQEREFWDRLDRGEADLEDYYLQDFWLSALGENTAKHLRLFGDADTRRFTSQEEAKAHMTSLTVPVWRLKADGSKVSDTATLTVHAALAHDVEEIFTEIYNDPSQFPIKNLGGYDWRGDKATGEHNTGTAIDINWEENYQITDGRVRAGSLWSPGENPYSIPADGPVVRIFAEHGWSWGGDAWATSTDPATGNHDYMHFSYMGE